MDEWSGMVVQKMRDHDEKVKDAEIALWNLSKERDTEAAHWEAEMIVIRFLRDLGYEKIADNWENVPKWYA